MAESPCMTKGTELPLPQDDRMGHFMQGMMQVTMHSNNSQWPPRSLPSDASASPAAATVQPSPKDSGVDMNSPIHREDLHNDHDDHSKTAELCPGSVESGMQADHLDADPAGLIPPFSSQSNSMPSTSGLLVCSQPISQISSTVTNDLSPMWTTPPQIPASSSSALKTEVDEGLKSFAQGLLSDLSDHDDATEWSLSAGLTSCASPPSLSSLSTSKGSTVSAPPAPSGFAAEFNKFLQHSNNKIHKKRKRRSTFSGGETAELPRLTLKRMESGDYTTMASSSSTIESPVRPLLKIKFGSPEMGGQKVVDIHCKDSLFKPVLKGGKTQTTDSSVACSHREESQEHAKLFDVKHYMVWRSKLLKLRRRILQLCSLLFPSLPLPGKDCAQVSCLLDQIICAAADSASPRLLAIPQACCGYEPRVLVCNSPKACVKHLRQKVCRLLQTLLPGLQVEGIKEARLVEDLLQRVIVANRQRSSSAVDIT